MDQNPTLALYGIQDRFDYQFPFYVHDHNLTIMHHGELREFIQLERISRVKRDNKLYLHLYDILKAKKLLGQKFDLVFVDNVVGRTFLTPKGDCRFEAPLINELTADLEEGRCWWFGEEQKAWVLNHELAHVFSCVPFFGMFKENSLLVHFDGGASLSNFSAWIFRNNKLDLVEANWNLKPLTTLFNANALVFAIIGAKLIEQNSVPGKLMGLAGYGKYDPKLLEWLKKYDFFENLWKGRSFFFEKAKADLGIKINSFDQHNSFIQDIVATIHQFFVDELLDVFFNLKQKTKAEYLYYSGGCALNIVANTELIKRNLFEDVYIPPCTEDSGLALGAAAFAEWKKGNTIKRHSAYLNNWGLDPLTIEVNQSEIKKCAKALLEGHVIGICNGNGEAGPRALGNRSLICLANSKQLAKKISEEHKGREWYRPVAPIMLEKNAKYFTGLDVIHPLAKYMLLDFEIQEDKVPEIIGAVHVDGTARIQTLFEKHDNPFMWELLSFLFQKYNIKALINTSFNAKGEPIVHTHDDALKSAHKMGIHAVVLDGKYKQLSSGL